MRPIEPLKDKIEPPENFGPVPELRWLPITRLVVDEAYQRPLETNGRGNIRLIAKSFSWLKFGPVVVSPVEGGSYAIVDGQHRTTAAASVGIESVPCLIIQADRKQQAEAFDAINARVTKVNNLSIYKAALAAGDADAARINAVCASAGVKIKIHKCALNTMKPHETYAVRAISRAVHRYGDDLAILVLKAVCASSGDSGCFLGATIISGVSEVLGDHPEWCGRLVFAAFEEIDLLSTLESAKERAHRDPRFRSDSLFQAAIVSHLDAYFTPKKELGRV